MSMRILLSLHLALVALVVLNAMVVFDWPAWADIVWLVGMVGAAAATTVVVMRDAPSRRPALTGLQILGALGLLAAAGSLAAPAWQVLGRDGAQAAASDIGRMAPMFLAALGLYGANLWLDGLRAAEVQEPLTRLSDLLSGPHLLPAFITALLLTAGMILAMDWMDRSLDAARVITRRLIDRGIIPPITVLLFFWGGLLLLGKLWNTWSLRRALGRWQRQATGPEDASLHALAAAPGELEESLALLGQRYEESYLFPRYISWAVPVLGFIGTVLGISLAADGIRRIIGSDTGLSGLSGDLSGAIAPLGIAFDTTLIALSLSVLLTLLLSLVQRSEERVLATLAWEMRRAGRAH